MDPKNLKKEYTNGDVTIVWQAGKCTHSANCVKNNPAVLNPKNNLGFMQKIQQQKKLLKPLKNVRQEH